VDLPDLPRDALAIFVFGPGVGELVAVSVPDAGWIIVDGCGPDEGSYGLRLLRHYRADVKAILMTHPHLDHCRGVAEVIEHATKSSPESWPRLGFAKPPQLRRSVRLRDPIRDLLSAKAEHVIATFQSRWEDHPSCRWDLQRDTSVTIGEATVTVVAPAPEAIRPPRVSSDYNRLSSAVRIRWRGSDLVLGGDLVQEPGQGWSTAVAAFSDLAAHVVLKVPHHASAEALYDGLLERPPGAPPPIWLVTPFSSAKLPRFDDGKAGGMRMLHAHVDRIHLTGLPRAHKRQHGSAVEMTRKAALESAAIDFDPTTIGFPDCWIAVLLPADGSDAVVHHGPGSLIVTPSPSRPKRR